ncbi:hypothetical protein Rs2_18574 [Raphanus sativus]|nr:hypothetical protein Rs2_18574 [Raphanus sativus]
MLTRELSLLFWPCVVRKPTELRWSGRCSLKRDSRSGVSSVASARGRRMEEIFFSDLVPLWKWRKSCLAVLVRSTESLHGESRLAGEGRFPQRTSRLRRGSQRLLWVAPPTSYCGCRRSSYN